ncbi:MAG: hypothetical protein FJ404_17775 [Verrucomicrobia bacterium]|nr:hypothetical protein [Verrucomicrobiota bacterium]
MGTLGLSEISAQSPGQRPPAHPGVEVLNPRHRVPVGLIIDDSTCLVNTNKFAMPQFDEAFAQANPVYRRPWRDWPNEIPDGFVRKFGEWCASEGVKGKYSVVPYPACVGRLDRQLPGWSAQALRESIQLVREVLLPHWDIHPEMVTHTRVIDLKTGHPHADHSLKFMENWEWTTGRSADEIASYMAYALRILKDIGLPCEGITTPGGFGNKARPQLAQASFESVRSVFGAEVPHYFRDLFDQGTRSVAPMVQNASGLDSEDPRCVVSILGCTGDWTGGWDCTNPVGADRFISPDGSTGRMVEVIERGEPAMMVCHWTGIYFNGYELGFQVFREVVKRLKSRFDHLIWVKLSELARYWAAKELTRMESRGRVVELKAPYACPDFTLRLSDVSNPAPKFGRIAPLQPLQEVSSAKHLESGTWCRDHGRILACLALPKGASSLEL